MVDLVSNISDDDGVEVKLDGEVVFALRPLPVVSYDLAIWGSYRNVGFTDVFRVPLIYVPCV